MKVLAGHKINWRRVDIAVLIGAALLAMALFWTAPHWWRKVGDAKVTYNNEASSDSSLYRSRDGKLLLHLRAQDEEDLYVIYPGGDFTSRKGASRHEISLFNTGAVDCHVMC